MKHTKLSTISRRQILSHAGIAGLGMAIVPSAAQAFLWNSHDNSAYYAVNGVAITGYDVVSYFENGRAQKGSANQQASWEGSFWHFSSAENLEAFSSNPTKYAPQYGGYCSYAAARNYIYRTDPTAFTIVDDKLYLNANHDIRGRWLRNRDSDIRKANQFWPKLSQKLA